MLLEVLSDFQISIPELGVIEARTHPIVVLTSNNSRELTEALKRRCLYLWLDYPEVEREMEIVRLHAPEIDEQLARRLVEVVHMVRQLDLKKPPSIAESIDWARALLLLGADDIDASLFARTMSIIVKHRTDMDLVAERVGMKLGGVEGLGAEATGMSDLAPGLAPRPRLVLRGAPRRGRGDRDLGDPRRLRGARDGAVDARGRLPRGARGDGRQVAGGPPGLRAALRSLLLPGRRVRGARARHRRGSPLRRRRAASTSTSCARPSARRSPTAATARCGTSRGWRSPPSAAAARARASSASTCSGSAARSACSPRGAVPRAATWSSIASRSTASSATCGASSSGP